MVDLVLVEHPVSEHDVFSLALDIASPHPDAPVEVLGPFVRVVSDVVPAVLPARPTVVPATPKAPNFANDRRLL